MKLIPRCLIVFCILLTGCIPIASTPPIEPDAGRWPTWVVTDVAAVRPPAPPDQTATQAELQEVQAAVASRDEAALQQIAYWDVGTPNYRWLDLTFAQLNLKPMRGPRNQRAIAYVNVAIYDAMVAAWDAKYTYNRARPASLSPGLAVVAQHTNSPSYPSEHAVAAGAAAEVLAYLFPDDAQKFADLANQAAQSRVIAGAHFPSDVAAGLALGKTVAQQVIARAKLDDALPAWDGVMPTEPGHWTGENPVEPLAGQWQSWTLTSPDEFRSPPPPAYDSPELAAELQEVKNFTRTWQINQKTLYWHAFEGGIASWYNFASLRIFEQGWDDNPIRAARLYALMSVAHHDSLVACWETKYTYWAIRPYQLDPEITVFFPTPHPSYPSGHSCATSAIAAVLVDHFPADAEAIRAKAVEAGESRIWGGIHFRNDITAGVAIGEGVAKKLIAWDHADSKTASK